mgnify:CR=1 FL=1
MGTDSLKLEFIQDFLAADLDESFITRLKKELKDFCSSKKSRSLSIANMGEFGCS